MTLNTSCEKCGAATRLVGIEPHPRLSDTDVWTFECASCGHSEIAAARHRGHDASGQGSVWSGVELSRCPA
jgi:hypothetical protein